MKKYFTLACALCFIAVNAQNVGINTTTPSATLDVDGNVKIRTVDAAAPANTYDYLVVDPTSKEVQKVNGNFDRNLSIAKAAANEGISLLTLGAFGDWKRINFATAIINPGDNFNTTLYTVPSNGIYEISYYFRYGTGVTANILGATQIGIFKQVGTATPTIVDSKGFSGVTLATVPLPILPDVVVGLTITNTQINSIYQFTAGEKISFEINSGGISLGLLGSSAAEVIIKKISN